MRRERTKSTGHTDDPAYWSHDLLTAEQERELAIRVREGDRAARDELILKNQKLVVSIAKQFLKQRRSLDDMVSAGNRGLIRAIEKFDPAKGFRFSTYASCWIRQMIRRDLESTSHTIRIPSHAHELMRRYCRMPARHGTTGEEQDFRAACDALKLPRGKRDCLVAALASCRDHAEVIPGDISVEDERPEDAESRALDRAMAKRLLSRLEPGARKTLVERFGLGGAKPRTLDEIARREGRSRECIRLREMAALARLRVLHKVETRTA